MTGVSDTSTLAVSVLEDLFYMKPVIVRGMGCVDDNLGLNITKE